MNVGREIANRGREIASRGRGAVDRGRDLAGELRPRLSAGVKRSAAALKPDDTRDLLRLAGGLLLGIGAIILVNRREADWPTLVLFLIYLIPAVVLFGGGILTIRDTGKLRPWQMVWAVFGLLFVPLTLFQFVDILGNSPQSPLNVFWIFAITTVLALYAGMEAGVRFQLLAASLAFLICVTALGDEIIGYADSDELYRLTLVLISAALLYAGVRAWRADRDEGVWKFSEFLTGAGLALILAFGLGVSITSQVTGAVPLLPEPASEPEVWWDLLLLAVSIALIAAGTLVALRGPVYAGALGLLIFVTSVGGGGTDVVWPLLLLLAGAGAIALSLSEHTLGSRPRDLVRRLSGQPPRSAAPKS